MNNATVKTVYTIFSLLLWSSVAAAQNPTYQVILRNDSVVSVNAAEYDVYLERTGIVPFELASAQLVFSFDTLAARGSISFTVDSGSSSLVSLQEPVNTRLSVSGNELRMAAAPPPGSGNGTVIPVAPGLRVGRFRITSPSPLANRPLNLRWKNSGLNPLTKLNAYVADVNTNVTDSVGHVNNLQNGSLSPVTITGNIQRPPGAKGVHYLDTLKAIYGTLPYTWSLSAGALPESVSLSANGVVAGVPSSSGDFAFTAMVTDSLGYSATKGFTQHIEGSYTLTAQVVGGGQVNRSPDQAEYFKGTGVTVTAIPLEGWVFSSWSGDTSTSSNPLVFTMNSSKALTATFTRDPSYLLTYRSFRADSLALDRDNVGKLGKYVKRKADKVFFKFTLRAPSPLLLDHLALTLRFSAATSGVLTTGISDTVVSWSGSRTIVTPSVIDTGATIHVEGIGAKGKAISTSYSWATSPRASKGTVTAYILNQPKNPMPNRVNALAEAYAFGGFGANGLRVGENRTAPTDSSKFYGWLEMPKYTDALKTLIVPKTLQMQTGAPGGFTTLMPGGTPIRRLQKTLPPTKFNDVLLANMIALKLNIAASELGKIPPGFGELLLDDSTSYAGMGSNVLNDRMVREIAAYGDSLMMGYYHAGVQLFADDTLFESLNRAIERINSAFEGDLDTLHFQDSLVFTGTRPLADVAYLKPNPGAAAVRIRPVTNIFVEAPASYRLAQNYPNPFNPTTTITFDLPQQALVTLKIYNILGQEVATLIDHELMDDGANDVRFDASNLASGVYFYRLIAQGVDDDGAATEVFTSVKRMMLIK